MALGERGPVFVGTRREGKVYALQDRDGSLYVAEVSRVIRFDAIEARLEEPEERTPGN